jgi:putative ABC transport system permease protein
MFSNYLKTAIRNIWKHRTYSIINILGLAIGLAIFSLTTGLFKFHLSFNKFHKDADRIYCLVQVLPSGETGERHTARTRTPLRKWLLDKFPEIEDATRWIVTGRTVVRPKDRRFYAEEGSLWFVDPNFLTLFSFEMIAGNPKTVFKEPNSVVLAETTARKYFGKLDVVGENLTVWKDIELKVTGITRDPPANSSLIYEALVSSDIYDWDTNWNVTGATFIKLTEKTSPVQLQEKFAALIRDYPSESPDRPRKLYLLALADLNLQPTQIRGYWLAETPQVLYLTFGIGILILLGVCFNYMNLATAQYFTRAKEVGIRKVVGASRNQLMGQFMGESVVLSLMAFPVALVLNEIIRPLFVYLGSPDPGRAGPELWSDPGLILLLLAIAVLVGIIAGSYPALILSRLAPVQVFKGNLLVGRKAALIRQLLIILQFTTAVFFILTTIAAYIQYNHLLNFDVGYQKEKILAIPLGTRYSRAVVRPLIDDLKRHPGILNASAATWAPAYWESEGRVIIEGRDQSANWTMNLYGVDYDFIEIFELEVIQGRSFSRKHGDSASIIINETAVRKLKLENPIGQKLSFWGRTGIVVGVVKDFYFKNLLYEIYPSVLFLRSDYLNYLFIKLSDAPISRVINYLDNRWQYFSADIPLEYYMMADRHRERLQGIQKWAGLAGMIGLLSIIFSCLGLYGMASYITQRRTKEIGIRKAHGASVLRITRLMTMEFLKIIAFGVVFGCPIFYIFDQILVADIFFYSVHLGPRMYVLAGAIALLTGLLAVLIQTIKAARANPIDSLRYE